MRYVTNVRRITHVFGPAVACALLTACASTTPLHQAAIRGDLDRIDRCVKQGISVNARDGQGNTPLHYAYYHGHNDAVARLVSFGADAAIRNRDGDTPADMEKIAAAEQRVRAGSQLLDSEAHWTDPEKARVIYDELRRGDHAVVTKAIVRIVLRNENRLRVLFLAVKLGIPRSEERLNDVLQAYGDKAMAEDYLNSGSQALYDGGRRWANAHGYYIATGMGSHRVAWGRF